MRDFVETVIEDRRPTWTSSQTEVSWRHCFETHVFPAVGGRSVSDVTLEDLRGMVAPLWRGRGSQGYVLRQRLDCVMRIAVAHKHRADNPAAVLKELLRKVTRRSTHRASLPHAEVTDAMRRVQVSGVDEAMRLLVVFVVLTAARYGEAAHLPWAELNLRSALWRVPPERMKARCVHRVPLSRQALAVLDRARALGRSDSAVFVLRGPGARFISNHAVNRFLRDLELRDEDGRFVTLHGFRSTYRVWAMEIDRVSPEISEASLAHQNPDETVRSYARSDVVDPRREHMHMQRWADYVLPPEAVGD